MNRSSAEAGAELQQFNTAESLSGAALLGRSWQLRDDVALRNAMTCDVEDYFQVSAFEDQVRREDWDITECRIRRNIDRILQIYADGSIKGTFFVLGWVAAKYPDVVRQIADQGHEIASHGLQHVRVWRQDSEAFRRDILETKNLLEDVTGMAVKGYRAASWSIDNRTPWAHQVIADTGYQYSSSIYPIAHDHFGMRDAPTQPFFVRGAGILEIPASTIRIVGRNWPAAGGGFFRLFPLSLSFWMIRRINRESGLPSMFYFHPWELDPSQPRIKGATARARFRHYLNLEKFEERLTRLSHSFQWDRMDRIYLDSE